MLHIVQCSMSKLSRSLVMTSVTVSCFTTLALLTMTSAQFSLLGLGDSDSDEPPNSNIADKTSASGNFTCPGVGTYGIKKPRRNSCTLFYDCPKANVKPRSIRQCFLGKQFNRLSRTCVDEKYVECRWCTKEGRHADITSRLHFIECIPGSIAVRYRCKSGKYNVEKRECEVKEWGVLMDITIDAEIDPPSSITEFQEKWTSMKKGGRRADSIEENGRISKKESNQQNEEEDTRFVKVSDIKQDEANNNSKDEVTKGLFGIFGG